MIDVWANVRSCFAAYGFGLVSDCVGSKFKGPCDDPARPVPCATKEGTCETDFISCLKAIAEEEIDGEGDSGGLGTWGGKGWGEVEEEEEGEKNKAKSHFSLDSS